MAVLDRLSEADTKRYAGQWVGLKDGKVLFAAGTPKEVADWLAAEDETADLVYRVPVEGEASTYFF